MEYALITGATSGIGFELSVLYAQNGYGLVLVSSSKEHLENTENRLNEQYSVPILIYEQDLTKQGAALELYNKIKQKKLDVTVLINNAGFGCFLLNRFMEPFGRNAWLDVSMWSIM